MRSLTALVLICIVLYVNAAKSEGNGQTTVHVRPGYISKLLGSKPTSISVDGYGKKQKQRPALLSRYPTQSDAPEQLPENQQIKPNKDPYTFLQQRPVYPLAQPYPQPYPVPVPYPQAQPIPPYQGYPPVYPGYPQYPVYPNYPPPVYPPPYPSKFPYPYPSKFPYPYPGYPPYMGYPGYPGYPLLAEPGDQSASTLPIEAPQNPDQVGEVVENPELESEANEENEIDPYVRKPKPTPAPGPVPPVPTPFPASMIPLSDSIVSVPPQSAPVVAAPVMPVVVPETMPVPASSSSVPLSIPVPVPMPLPMPMPSPEAMPAMAMPLTNAQ